MYLLIRIVIIVVLFTCVFVAFRNEKLRNRIAEKLKYINPEKVKIVFFVFIIVFILAIFYPFESKFIRFDTVEESVNYSLYNFNPVEKLGSEIYIAEDDDTAFIVNKKGNTYRFASVTKYEDGYGFCNNNVDVDITSNESQFISAPTYSYVVDFSTIYNGTTNKTCFIIGILDDDSKSITDIEILDENKESLVQFANEKDSIDFYYIIYENKPKDTYAFYINGIEIKV